MTKRVFLLAAVFAALAPPAARPAGPVVFYVSPAGSDTTGGGTKAKPWASIAFARDAVRARKRRDLAAGPVTMYLRGGTHVLNEPLVFGPEDSGTATAPVSYAVAPGETPVVSGGTRITGWKRSGDNLWSATVPGVASGAHPYFRQLWVGNERRYRARTYPWPRDGKKERTKK